jgi:tetratricopeptide (TPR) repeat protein
MTEAMPDAMTDPINDDARSDNAGVPLVASAILPALSHRIYTLIGFAWPAFGLIFLVLLCSTDWFALPMPIWQLFVPACLIALALGHIVALVLESGRTTAMLYYFRRGMPLIFYQRFAVLQEPGAATAAAPIGEPAIVFGGRRILFSAVDELYLTFLGVLEIKSYAASGRVKSAAGSDKGAGSGPAPALNKADLLVRVPIGALPLGEQKRLVEIFRSYRPGLTVNKRLDDRLKSPIVKGQAAIAATGAMILLFALFDVSYATFTWLEMLRDYYGSQLCSRQSDRAAAFVHYQGSAPMTAPARAAQLYERAEALRLHPARLSWAYRALFANGNSGAQLSDIRAETLYRLGREQEAIDVLVKALPLKTSGFKTQLQLARYLSRAGRNDEARALMDAVLEKHKDVLLPRLYELVLLPKGGNSADLYNKYLAELDEEVFGEEPAWPPGGEKPMMEMWRREDLDFLAQYFLKLPSRPGKGH